MSQQGFPDIALALDQILEGWDIPTPATATKVSKVRASAKGEAWPYSMATNLEHTVYWQDIWIRALQGGRATIGMQEWKNDWRVPEAGEWAGLRDRFLSGLLEARAVAQSGQHRMKSEEDARKTLMRIVIHASYHLGQIYLLKRATRKADDSG